ncbi:MAG: PA2169 family four-helix-bundle protein [Acidobacteria bacterium]|nr:PA2169 family four-helix-bundle protein [Acidobacteriota bacterium]
MATNKTTATNKATSQGAQMPLDNLSYDILTIVYEKSKGLEAYEKYIKDAQGDPEVSTLLEQIRQQDAQAVEQLQQHLHRLLGSRLENRGSAARAGTAKATATGASGGKSNTEIGKD